jgi:hypothetical protein
MQSQTEVVDTSSAGYVCLCIKVEQCLSIFGTLSEHMRDVLHTLVSR